MPTASERRLLCLILVIGLGGIGASVITASAAKADVIVTQSGGRFEGTVEEDRDAYVLTTANGGKMRFPKTAVREIIRSEGGAPRDGPTREAAKQQGPQAAKVGGGGAYLEIPIEGVIGEQVFAEEIEKVLVWAARGSAAKHIVFRIKSPGGFVDEAKKIADVMEKYHHKFTYHAYVEQAISAAIFPAFSCDKIWMAGGGAFGGAVAYLPTKTGNEVDAKMNSVLASQVASLAQKNGHSGIIAKAMIVMGEQAYAWIDEGKKPQIADALPAGISEASLIVKDTETTVLTLTEEQAVRAGIAGQAKGGPAGIGAALGMSVWQKASDYGENVVSRVKSNREKEEAAYQAAVKQNQERTAATILYIQQNINEAVSSDPGNFTYSYDILTGLYTPESALRWRRQTDMAIAAWRRVQSGALTLTTLEKEADKLGLEPVVHRLNLLELVSRAAREIAMLVADRNRIGP